ncbi:4-alpha-glucanotransferase [Rhodoferax koreense]|uniref:4-alpha-glucanotransferase n=1 Tax=Rhodoferax koreensis TaxID=1842727 RepID=A0A1P8JWV4_9BURK|nr:4-alpha-glucanotransferase [Rhodoferax koreense]APW38240.1 4-alpha-glucanotransferase [Rhodoferax koreense]
MRLPRTSGILLHPTSLPGPNGSGDFGPAAYHFVDWLVSAGQKLWQILPLGGIGPGNSPYMSSSAFAGNVLLIDLAELQTHGWLASADLEGADFEAGRLDFARVVPWRMDRLARAAAQFASAASPADVEDFNGFCAAQADWLDDYALFMALAEANEWREWSDWAPSLVRREPAALAAARLELSARVGFWQFCQWCFFRQWLRLKHYANERGILIVGDAPIFIAYQSAEVWARQELFELDASGKPTVIAGVPPDYFSATGQRWGNPLYRWSAHADEGYAWWIARIRRTFAMVDIVRIDHFRGFADYWEIPASQSTAIFGRWLPGPGAALFDAIASALGSLPIIAEDLGIITPEVEALRRQFDFPGMRILHFAFGGDAGNAYLPHNYEPNTVVYTGTHDNNTTPGWWAEASEAERLHVIDYLGLHGTAIDADIHWSLIRAAMASVADTAITQLQDVLGLPGSDRMNLPGVGAGYWEWRFTWDQVLPEHALKLAQLGRLYRRG